MTTYCIPITKDNLDLIQFLNSGVRPALEEKETNFIFTIYPPDGMPRIEDIDIKAEDDTWNAEGTQTIPPELIRL